MVIFLFYTICFSFKIHYIVIILNVFIYYGFFFLESAFLPLKSLKSIKSTTKFKFKIIYISLETQHL